MQEFNYKYNEGNLLQEMEDYIKSTYKQHYTGMNDAQLFDIFENAGILQPYCIGAGSGYLLRYGKKEGFNRKDLKKAIHVALIALYCHDRMEQSFKDEGCMDEPKMAASTINEDLSFVPYTVNTVFEETSYINQLADMLTELHPSTDSHRKVSPAQTFTENLNGFIDKVKEKDEQNDISMLIDYSSYKLTNKVDEMLPDNKKKGKK